MNKNKRNCDLCGLPVEILGITLLTNEGQKSFCCEGCKGIYKMLHDDLMPLEPKKDNKS
ncbi:MAG: metal-binding protein [Methylococcaceae bacterium]|nr:metal-binding protein [Methylococcaceae bacterium]